MTTLTWFSIDRYTNFLKRYDFNEDQINFLIDQRNAFESLKRNEEIEVCETCGKKKNAPQFDYDGYEREMWYTMNRSGLFEDDEENKTGITNWTPHHTRRFITECN